MGVLEWSGTLPAQDVSWAEANRHLTSQSATARLIYLGERTAWSTAEKASLRPNKRSSYAGRFKQGATIVPRNLYFVRLRDFSDGPDPDRIYWAETDPDQAKEAKKPYQDVRISGQVEGAFIYRAALARHVLPFLLLDPSYAVLPLIREGSSEPRVLDSGALKAAGFRAMGEWMEEAEEIWNSKQGEKAQFTAVQRLNYHNELTAQAAEHRFLLVYNASGTDLAAAIVDRELYSGRFVADAKLYWAECGSREEAHYLAAVLNSSKVNEAIKPFQSMGLLGQRDIHKKVLDLPIPLFDRGSSEHRQLADAGAEAWAQAKQFIARMEVPASLARRRARVREALASVVSEIDRLVGRLLGGRAGFVYEERIPPARKVAEKPGPSK